MSIALRDGAGRTAYKLDLAYVLTKMVCAVDETPLPGWTGFNTMLHEEIPDVRSVGYLPVINASPTEYSTIKEILKRSKSIAEKLKLKYAVLVFDSTFDGKNANFMTSSSFGLVNSTASCLSCLHFR